MQEIFFTVLSITGIAGALAVVISLAERVLNNYGECTLDINDGSKSLVVEGGQTLLSSLAAQKIFIPSACGGKATCGLCKLQVLEGAGPLLPTEEPYLTAQEKKDNYRLACQVKVKQDMKLAIPEELFNIKEFVCDVEKIENLTHDIKLVRLKLPEGETVNFKAGQFMQFYTKPYGKVSESVFRAYSISSPPSDDTHLEFCIRQVPMGIATTYVHTALNQGDKQQVSGPYGDFMWHGEKSQAVFVAVGSGLAPMRSLLYDLLETKGETRPLTFYFGATTVGDLYYVEEMRALEEKYPNFRFRPTISNPKPEEKWDGPVGYVQALIDEDLTTPEIANDCEGYLCGGPGFLNGLRKYLVEKGLDYERIYFDEF